jgi:hypothetical protein
MSILGSVISPGKAFIVAGILGVGGLGSIEYKKSKIPALKIGPLCASEIAITPTIEGNGLQQALNAIATDSQRDDATIRKHLAQRTTLPLVCLTHTPLVSEIQARVGGLADTVSPTAVRGIQQNTIKGIHASTDKEIGLERNLIVAAACLGFGAFATAVGLAKKQG